MATSNIYSRNRTVNYEKIINSILCNNNNNSNRNSVNDSYKTTFNKALITDVAFNMAEIASDKTLVNKYIENNLNYLIKNTMQKTISQIKLIPDYRKKELGNCNSEYSRIGLKVSQSDKEIIENILQDSIDYNSFYEIYLNNNNNINNNKTRNICVHFCSV